MLALHELSARYATARSETGAALEGLSFRVSAGEALAVIGPSGAGKTTLLEILACARHASEGTLEIEGQNPWRLPSRELRKLRGRIILVPQVPPLPPRQRVVTAVLAGRLPSWSFATSLRSLMFPVDVPMAKAALDVFDLGDKLFERVDRLSGGERQRVGLARALVAPARLWLVDEPLSALDPLRAERAAAALVCEAKSRGNTLVSTLHQVDTALRHFPRILGLRDGRLMFDLPAGLVSRELLARLYAHHEAELNRGPTHDELPKPVSTTIVHCR